MGFPVEILEEEKSLKLTTDELITLRAALRCLRVNAIKYSTIVRIDALLKKVKQ